MVINIMSQNQDRTDATKMAGYKNVWLQKCLATKMSGYKNGWLQKWLATKMSAASALVMGTWGLYHVHFPGKYINLSHLLIT